MSAYYISSLHQNQGLLFAFLIIMDEYSEAQNSAGKNGADLQIPVLLKARIELRYWQRK
jgi:hypothetical protein